MGSISEKEVQELQDRSGGIEVIVLKNGMVAYKGPWLKDKYYDNYTECLYANINHKRVAELKAKGLNDQGQTKEQEADLKKRIEESKRVEDEAKVAREMVKQTK